MLLKTYYPHPRFPPISLSAARCDLHCRHCDGAYLRAMAPADTPEALLAACRALRRRGALGALLSGGADRAGRLLNLRALLPAIQQARQETGLLFNLHPGLLDSATACALRVDFASLEIPSRETIRDVFGLRARVADYLDTYAHLQSAGIEVVPHVCVYNGDEDRLLRGLAPPRVIVVIVFSPTRNTPMAATPPPTPESVGHVIAQLKANYPETEISLGCMRPRHRDLRVALERAALQAGATRIVLPASATLRYAHEQGYAIQSFDACCALPVEYEAAAQQP